jgi:tetratricopeptide (TPR) repeat protein
MFMKRAITIMALLLITLAVIGCPKAPPPSNPMDTAQHHTEMGDRAVLEGKWTEALEEYTLALKRDPKYIPALMGQAICLAQAGKKDEAGKVADEAFSVANSDAKRYEYHVRAIVFFAYMGGNDWIKKSEKSYKQAKELDEPRAKNDEKLNYNMGWAYFRAQMFSEAEPFYRKTIEINGSLRVFADKDWLLLQKIVRARPGTPNGARIALVQKITRADVAALFIEEMHLPELWQKRSIKKWEAPQFQTPQQAAAGAKGPIMPTDIATHPLKNDIEQVILLGIRGLETAPDGKFYPDKEITRAEYAVMLEDILIKVVNEPGLATRYVGEANSHFHDMTTSNWAYNASVVVSERQIMTADLEGNFKPMDPVAGVDALLVIRQMMDYLKIG